MNELVKKIARALARHSIEPWDDLSPENRDGYEEDARACLAEIEAAGMVIVPREPPGELSEAEAYSWRMMIPRVADHKQG